MSAVIFVPHPVIVPHPATVPHPVSVPHSTPTPRMVYVPIMPHSTAKDTSTAETVESSCPTDFSGEWGACEYGTVIPLSIAAIIVLILIYFFIHE